MDVLIASAHAGMFAEFDEDGASDSAERIVNMVPELDAMLVGHMHIVVNEKSDKPSSVALATLVVTLFVLILK